MIVYKQKDVHSNNKVFGQKKTPVNLSIHRPAILCVSLVKPDILRLIALQIKPGCIQT